MGKNKPQVLGKKKLEEGKRRETEKGRMMGNLWG